MVYVWGRETEMKKESILSAGPGESESWRQGGVLALENNIDLVGSGYEWSNVGFLNKQHRNRRNLHFYTETINSDSL